MRFPLAGSFQADLPPPSKAAEGLPRVRDEVIFLASTGRAAFAPYKRRMYDACWEATAHLKDGTEVRLRLIRPEDKVLLEHGFAELSAESRFFRFFTSKKSLSLAELSYLTELDQQNHVAVGASTPDLSEGLGVARFIRDADGSDAAEVAVAVVERIRRRGLAHLLLQHLAAAALERGVKRFRFCVLASNHPMLTLLQSVSASAIRQQDNVITYEWALFPSSAMSFSPHHAPA